MLLKISPPQGGAEDSEMSYCCGFVLAKWGRIKIIQQCGIWSIDIHSNRAKIGALGPRANTELETMA